jgi:hypothetical protein
MYCKSSYINKDKQNVQLYGNSVDSAVGVARLEDFGVTLKRVI